MEVEFDEDLGLKRNEEGFKLVKLGTSNRHKSSKRCGIGGVQ
jgi:hypothetical protein